MALQITIHKFERIDQYTAYNQFCTIASVALNHDYLLVMVLNPNWHEGRYFSLLVLLDQILSAEFLSKFPNFLEVKIDINWVNLTP